MASIVPGSAKPEQTTTGNGSVAMICLRKVSPSIRGISRSRRITWGRWRRILAIATTGSEAVARRMPACGPSSALISWRTTAESSTTSTSMRGGGSCLTARPL